MFSWFTRILGRGAPSSGRSASSRGVARKALSLSTRQTLIDSLDDLIKTPGKACYRTLVQLATSSTEDDFATFVHCPAFVGAGIRDGELERRSSSNKTWAPQTTQMFNPTARGLLIEGASIDQCIFLLRKPVAGNASALKRFTVGRGQGSDILINDFAISREHAVVEIRGGSFYLKDLGSSNGTYVNGAAIDDRGTLLENGAAVRFARYEFQFLLAAGLYELMRERSVAASDLSD
jgi:hypothetical protein